MRVLRSRWTLICVGLAASAIFVYLAIRGLDLGVVKRAFGDAHLLPWLPIGVAAYLISHVVRGIRLRVLVRKQAQLSLPTATNIVVLGYGANNVLPARLGELVRAGMLAERTNMPIAQSLGITFIERVLDGLVLLFLFVVASVRVEVVDWMRDLMLVALFVFGLATIATVVGALWPRLVIALASRVARPLGARLHGKLVSVTTQVTNAGACLRDPKDALALGLSSIVVWALEAVNYVVILSIFGIPASFEFAVITMCVTGFGLLLPSSPGAIGPYHYFAMTAIMVAGVSAPTALAYATLVHLSWFLPNVIWGAIVMLWYGVKLGSVVEKAPEPTVPVAASAASPSA